jgi:hypothetical protein
MGVDVSLDAALVVGLGPSALPVLPVDLILDLADEAVLHELGGASGDEEARVTPVHEGDADALGLGRRQHRLQYGDRLDDDLGWHRVREPDRLEQRFAL